MKVMTFNVYNRPWQRTARLANIAETVRAAGPDIVALQEVAQGWLLPGDPVKSVEDAFGPGRLNVVRHWHETNWGIFKTGVALLSRFPIEESEYHEFAKHQFWDYKGFLRARVRTPAGPLTVFCLHLASTDDPEIKGSELSELAAQVRFRATEGPVLILGDFNEDARSKLLTDFVNDIGARSLYSRLAPADVHGTWTPWYWDRCDSTPGQTLDHILIVGPKLSFEGGGIVVPEVKPHPSDHCPVTAELQLLR